MAGIDSPLPATLQVTEAELPRPGAEAPETNRGARRTACNQCKQQKVSSHAVYSQIHVNVADVFTIHSFAATSGMSTVHVLDVNALASIAGLTPAFNAYGRESKI